MNDVVFHNRWFYYEDQDTGDIYKIKYKNYANNFSTLVFKKQTTKKKYSLFGIRFGPMIKTYKRIFSSRYSDYGPVIDRAKTYTVIKTKDRIKYILNDYKNSKLYKDSLIISKNLKHSEFLGDESFKRDIKIDLIFKK